MTKEQSLLLSLLRTCINGNKLCYIDADIDWKIVADEARAQAVSLMAFDASSEMKKAIPQNVYDKWFKYCLGRIKKYAKVGSSQKELVTILDREKISYCIIKGEAAAAYYPQPLLRAFGDVDFLIEGEDKEKIKELLIKNGFESSLEDHICHMVFTKPNSHLEMHFEVAGIPDGIIGNKIREFLKCTVFDTVVRDIGNGEFNAPSDIYHCIILLLHMQHHLLGEGIGLRHLCDWACFVNRTSEEVFWTEDVIPFLKEVGMYSFMTAMTKVCCKYLDIGTPCWLTEVNDSVVDTLIEDILQGGNFGRKDNNRMRTGMLITNRGKDGFNHNKWHRMYSVVKRNIDAQYPNVKEYPIMYPFYLIGKVLRYMLLSLKGERQPLMKLTSGSSIFKSLKNTPLRL